MNGVSDSSPHLTDKEAEMETEIVSCQGSQSYSIVGLGLTPRSPPGPEEDILNDSIDRKRQKRQNHLVVKWQRLKLAGVGGGGVQDEMMREVSGWNVLYLILVVICGVCIYQSSLNYPIKMNAFIICKLYFNKSYYFLVSKSGSHSHHSGDTQACCH